MDFVCPICEFTLRKVNIWPVYCRCGVRFEEGQSGQSSGIGTALESILKKQFGAEGCNACRDDILALNGQSADQVVKNLDKWVSRIYLRRKQLPKAWQRVLSELLPAQAKGRIQAAITQAIQASESS